MKKTDNRWEMLLNSRRRKHDASGKSRKVDPTETRTEIERDYDRILFSTPVRRLADKTQVFPLDKNDSVRTRLTHSHEVSNLARSIGTTLAFNHRIAGNNTDSFRNIPSLLAAIGLAHDLGNPPFGHQGEAAIQSWFEIHKKDVLEQCIHQLSDQQKQDFLKFEGNAQGFRLVTRLQLLNDDFGLDLTYATLSGMMKYPTCSVTANKKNNCVATKKHGFFAAEQEIAKTVQSNTGLDIGLRHPLTYIMEACDDIAYVVLDVEDAVKKGLASFSDLTAFLEHGAPNNALVRRVVKKSIDKHNNYRRDQPNLSPAELNDVSMQLFRVYAIGEMIKEATKTFLAKQETFLTGQQKDGLLSLSKAETLRMLLKDFGVKHAYTHRSVLEVELEGYNVITGLMDIFWAAITDIDDPELPSSKRRQPFTRYVYGRISENYRRIYEDPKNNGLPTRYKECLLLTDMISGMTDSFATDLYRELAPLKQKFDLARKDFNETN